MSFLSDLFGTLFGGSDYSGAEYSLSHEDVRRLVSQTRINSLSQDEVVVVEEAILSHRRDGKISLNRMNEVLGKLVHARKISEIDRQAVMKVFKKYFSK